MALFAKRHGLPNFLKLTRKVYALGCIGRFSKFQNFQNLLFPVITINTLLSEIFAREKVKRWSEKFTLLSVESIFALRELKFVFMF